MIQKLFRSVLISLVVLLAAACSRQTAEEKGKELATEKIDMVKGIGDALQEKGSEAAKSVAHGAGNVLQGANTGLEEAFEWKIVQADAMSKNGLTISRVQHGKPGEKSSKTVDIYVVANADANGSLSMVAYDVVKREVVRTKIDLKMGAKDGRYETLELDERTDLGAIREVSFDYQPMPAEQTTAK